MSDLSKKFAQYKKKAEQQKKQQKDQEKKAKQLEKAALKEKKKQEKIKKKKERDEKKRKKTRKFSLKMPFFKKTKAQSEKKSEDKKDLAQERVSKKNVPKDSSKDVPQTKAVNEKSSEIVKAVEEKSPGKKTAKKTTHKPFWKNNKSPEELVEQPIRPIKKKKPKLTRLQRKRNLQSYLNKSGYYNTHVENLKQRIYYIALVLTGLPWFVFTIYSAINGGKILTLFIFTILSWTGLLLLVWILLWGIIYFYLELRMYSRTKELESVLPDFLQLTSANISAGMPIDRALWLAIRPNFGVLAKEIEDVAKSTLSGEDLIDSLQMFVERYDSTMLKRSISILIEGLNAGGELADLLNKISLNIQELKIMKKEMAANVTTYAIFISFASVGIAPVLFALATQLIVIILAITGGIDVSNSSSNLSITVSAAPDLISNFKIYSVFMLMVTAGMSAAIISVIRSGAVRDGIRNIPIYMGVSFVIYTIANLALEVLLSGFF